MWKHKSKCNPTKKEDIVHDVDNDPNASEAQRKVVHFGISDVIKLSLLAGDVTLPELFSLKSLGQWMQPVRLKRVPQAQSYAQHISNQIWEYIVRAVAEAEDQASMQISNATRLFYVFTTLVMLRDRTEGGNSSRKHKEHTLLKRFQDFVEGRWAILDDAITRSQQPDLEADPARVERSEAVKTARKRTRVQTLVGDAELSKAQATCDSNATPMRLTAELQEVLNKKLNSSEPDWSKKTVVTPTKAPKLEMKTMKKMFTKLTRSTASGLDNLSKDWIQFFMGNATKLQWVTLMNEGKLPLDMVRYIVGARATCLPKQKALDLRPILPETILARLATATLFEQFKDKARDVLGPWQIAVNQNSGGEIAKLGCEYQFFQYETTAHCSSDVANGYGSVDRQELLEAIEAELPEFSSWAETKYGERLGHQFVQFFDADGKLKWLKVK